MTSVLLTGCNFNINQTSDHTPTEHVHTPGTPVEENKIEPTCVENGSYDLVTYCVDDGVEMHRETIIIPATGHDLIHHDGQAATCTEDGWLEYDTCSKCDYSTFQSIPATNHPNQEVREENRIEATCTEDGSYDLVTYCLDENIVLSSEHIVLKATGHDLIHHDGKEPCVGEDGFNEYDTCSKCDYSTFELRHNLCEPVYQWNDDFSECKAVLSCSNCDYILYETSYCSCATISRAYSDSTKISVYKVYNANFSNNNLVSQSYEVLVEELDGLDNLSFRKDEATNRCGVKAANRSIESAYIPTYFDDIPVTHIMVDAFYNCSSLTSVTIPNSVVYIGRNAFYKCSSLTSLTIPNSVNQIPENPFYGCTSLSEIVLDKENPYFTFDNGVLFDKNLTTLISFLAFQQSSYNIPNTVTTIVDSAFSHCKNLTSITFPDSLITIKNSAFSNCSSLQSIVLPDSVETIGANAFFYCTSVSYLKLGCNVKKIGSEAFRYCNINSVVIPASAEAVAYDAFYNESNEIEIYFVVKSFKDFVSIKRYEARLATFFVHLIDENGKEIKEVVIPEGVEVIEEGSFYGCTSITSITIPNGVSEIGKYAFESCSSLTSIILPNSLTTIYGSAFKSCTSLSSIVLPNSLTTIYGSLFENCSSLTSIIIPDSVETILSEPFKGCSSLKYIYLGKGVKSFSNSPNIHPNPFKYCDNLETIDVSPDNPYFSSTNGVLFNKEETIIYRCPSKNNLSSISIPSTVKTIYNDAFLDCINIKSVLIPYGVTLIYGDAFYGCTSLTSISIPNSVTELYSGAFNNCSSLTSINFGSGITGLASYLVRGCTSLKSIYLPKTIVNISSFALKECGCNYLSYGGTISEWKKVSKGYDWHPAAVKVVHCTNGDTTL